MVLVSGEGVRERSREVDVRVCGNVMMCIYLLVMYRMRTLGLCVYLNGFSFSFEVTKN